MKVTHHLVVSHDNKMMAVDNLDCSWCRLPSGFGVYVKMHYRNNLSSNLAERMYIANIRDQLFGEDNDNILNPLRHRCVVEYYRNEFPFNYPSSIFGK